MISVSHANDTIPVGPGSVHNYKKRYNTQDIVEQVLWGDNWLREHSLMKAFATQVPPTLGGMRMLYDFLYRNITYKADPRGAQWVKSPSALWEDREGDCKSFTLFIVSVAQELDLEYIIRFTSYKKRQEKPTHVYPIIILPDGENVIIDPVWGLEGSGAFNTEKPYRHKKDYHMKPEQGLAFIHGTTPDSNTVLQAVEDILTNVPKTILDDGDITEMTEGEAQRYFMARRLEAQATQAADPMDRNQIEFAASVIREGAVDRIGALDSDRQGPVMRYLRETERLNAPAFTAPKIRISRETEEAIGRLFKRIWNGIKKGAKAVGKGAKAVGRAVAAPFRKAWSLLMNWIFKGPIQKASPFFLFTLLKRNPGGEVGRRMKKQDGVKEFMVRLGVKRNTLNSAITGGITEELGDKPEKILAGAARGQISGIGAAGALLGIIFKAVGWVINVVKKVANLFKKKDPVINESDTSDIRLLDPPMVPAATPPFRATSTSGQASNSSASIPRNSSGNAQAPQGSGLAIAAGLAAAVLAFS